MAKNSNEYKNLWLHNEIVDNSTEQFTILPYTTIESIKIGKNGNFTDFATNYAKLKESHNYNSNQVIPDEETSEYQENSLGEAVEKLHNILYGVANPDNNEGKDEDIYIQHGDNKIKKIWTKQNGTWIS